MSATCVDVMTRVKYNLAMGWRERDWARFRDDERRALFGGGGSRATPPSDEGLAHRSSPALPRPHRTSAQRRPISRRRQKVGEGALTVLLALGALAFAYDHLHTTSPSQPLALSPVLPLGSVPVAKPVVVEPPSKVIGIRWRTTDLAPAAQAGRICVTASAHGRICASYVVGERPADTLTRRIEGLGLSFESSG
jgi:hypothetical protein